MKYLRQLIIILGISFVGELCNRFIPLPIPSSIYALVIMLMLLCTGVLKTAHVKETSELLLDLMPVMFIPAAAGIINYWSYIQPILIPCIIIFVVVTIIVMAVTGRVTQGVCRLFKITEPVAIGAAIGTASHAGGTSKAIQMGKTEGAISGLAIAVAGIMTVVIAPIVMNLVK